MKPALSIITEPTPPPRVCDIDHREHEHAWRCVRAWRQREHPAWSQHHVSFQFQVSERKLRRVK